MEVWVGGALGAGAVLSKDQLSLLQVIHHSEAVDKRRPRMSGHPHGTLKN